MALDYHLDRKIIFSEESEYKNLYKWFLQETDEAGKPVGPKVIPWRWDVVFTATEMNLMEQFSIEPEFSLRLDDEDEKREPKVLKKEEKERIQCKLRPGYWVDPDDAERYSMLGTSRHITDFVLWIYEQKEIEKGEYCGAWGCVSYDTNYDFGNERVPDTLQFYLHVLPEKFARYKEMIRKYPASVLAIRVGEVDGFYSDWSPDIKTNRIKVLTRLNDHQLVMPEDHPLKLRTVGNVGRFELTISTTRQCDKPPRPVEADLDEDISEIDQGRATSPEEEALILQRAALKLALHNDKRFKHLSWATWIIVALLLILVGR